MELPKTYTPQDHEDKIYKEWEDKKLFKPEVNPDGKPFTISLPPPNATGTLHLGHATMLAVEDLMIRYHRLIGDKTLWLPGTDHAAIATQSKVEKIIKEKEGKTRHDLGRDEFLKRVREFVASSQDTIRNQVRKMGSSVDWDRERYTLDDSLNRVVSEVFVKMYNDGLIYRGHRIVNWDPIGQTTVADDEIEYKEEKSPFYTFKYGPFEIGTARPETKFGDKYVVMHPKDKRYKKYKHGQEIDLEWINCPIKATVIKDEAVDMEFGTGVMTITPWHSVMDFDIAQRHDLDKEQIIDKEGKLLAIADEFEGLNISEARSKIVEKLEKKGLLVKIDEDYVHNVAVGDRFKGKIEPQIMEQWFVDVNKPAVEWKKKKMTLKEMMQDMVRSGDVEIIPDRFNKTYFHWIDNLRDWCISRQIWWGHRIPVWYHEPKCVPRKGHESDVGKCIDMIVQAGKPECGFCDAEFIQDPDTLDTWFSSAFWTWSTLIDPKLTKDMSLSLQDLLDKSPDMQTFHPTQVMETGYDILFFWVARMILMTGYVVGERPFEKVYLHGLVRDKQGRKMSKSLGNGIDPVEVIDEYGADAVRLSLVIGTSPGNDSRLFNEKIAGYRNFVNKLWNIARFILMSVKEPRIVKEEIKPKTLSDRWILSRLQKLIKSTTENVEGFKFSPAGENLYNFTWSELADWYLEDSKVEGSKDEILLYALRQLLKLWHPYTPFVTEVLWKELKSDHQLIVAHWPKVRKGLIDEKAEKEYEQYQAILTSIRNARAEFNIPFKTEMKVVIEKGDEQIAELLKSRAKLSSLEFVDSFKTDEKVITYHINGGVKAHLFVEGLIDFEKEKARLQKDLENAEKYLKTVEKKMSNKKFVKNAPDEVVEAEKNKMTETQHRLDSLKAQIKALSS